MNSATKVKTTGYFLSKSWLSKFLFFNLFCLWVKPYFVKTIVRLRYRECSRTGKHLVPAMWWWDWVVLWGHRSHRLGPVWCNQPPFRFWTKTDQHPPRCWNPKWQNARLGKAQKWNIEEHQWKRSHDREIKSRTRVTITEKAKDGNKFITETNRSYRCHNNREGQRFTITEKSKGRTRVTVSEKAQDGNRFTVTGKNKDRARVTILEKAKDRNRFTITKKNKDRTDSQLQRRPKMETDSQLQRRTKIESESQHRRTKIEHRVKIKEGNGHNREDQRPNQNHNKEDQRWNQEAQQRRSKTLTADFFRKGQICLQRSRHRICSHVWLFARRCRPIPYRQLARFDATLNVIARPVKKIGRYRATRLTEWPV